MAKKYKVKYLHDDFEVILAIKYCFDRGIKYYPVVIEGQTHALKYIPKVKIEMYQGGKTRTGDVEYAQGEELYDKICELYMHKYAQLNKNMPK